MYSGELKEGLMFRDHLQYVIITKVVITSDESLRIEIRLETDDSDEPNEDIGTIQYYLEDEFRYRFELVEDAPMKDYSPQERYEEDDDGA